MLRSDRALRRDGRINAPKGFYQLTLRQAAQVLPPELFRKYYDTAQNFFAANAHLSRDINDIVVVVRAWDESEHPRVPAGGPGGGQFGEGGGGGSSGGAEYSGSQLELWPGLFPPATGPKGEAKLDDFEKDHIELDRATKSDPEKAGKFLQVWNDRVQSAPHDFRNQFLGGIKGTMNVRFDDEAETMELEGKLQGESGNNIGSYTRTIDFKENKAVSEFFALSSRETGKDVGKRLLAANVAMYQKLGLDEVEVHANIDVGGYAWAKYGYVPTRSSWNSLTSELIENIGGGGGGEVSSWEEMSDDQQSTIFETWKQDTQSEFYDSELENWHESGRALDDAKVQLADEYDSEVKWANNAVDKWRSEHPTPLTNKQILDAVEVEYRSTSGDGRNDADFTLDDDKLTELGLPEDGRDALVKQLSNSFDGRAQDLESELDPPSYIDDSVSELQTDTWDNMRDRDKFRWASDHDALPEAEGGSSTLEGADSEEIETLRELAEESDPKAIWAIADSDYGKPLLLGTDWNGTLDLHDQETMDRFNAYVGKEKPKATA